MNRTMRYGAYLAFANKHELEPWISSEHLAEYCDIQASQVRRDLAAMRVSGKRGVGYRPATIQIAITAWLESRVDQVLADSLRMATLAGGIHIAAVRVKNRA